MNFLQKQFCKSDPDVINAISGNSVLRKQAVNYTWKYMYKKIVEEGTEYTRNIRFERYTIRGTAELVESTNENPNELKLMIGTRTIDETEEKRIFREALESAYKKVISSENKLIQ